MLKLNASYSKKVPVLGQDYSSQSYHASIEVEIPDGLTQAQLQERIHGTFALVKDSVEAELSEGGKAETPAPHAPARDNTPQESASPAQIHYLTDLAIRRKMDVQALNAEARRLYQVDDMKQLTRKQASDLIDHLNGGKHRRAA